MTLQVVLARVLMPPYTFLSFPHGCPHFPLAGHETTSQAVTFALFLLAKHPEWQDRAREEARRVLGGGGGVPSREAVSSGALPLLTCIVYEALRLFPAVPNISRVAACDVTLEPAAAGAAKGGALSPLEGGPLHIKAGTGVVVSIAMLHRDKVRARGRGRRGGQEKRGRCEG